MIHEFSVAGRQFCTLRKWIQVVLWMSFQNLLKSCSLFLSLLLALYKLVDSYLLVPVQPFFFELNMFFPCQCITEHVCYYSLVFSGFMPLSIVVFIETLGNNTCRLFLKDTYS